MKGKRAAPFTTGRGRIAFLGAACALVVLVISSPTPSLAQDARPDSPYGGLWPDRTTLTGNWGGARDDLAAQGIVILPSLTGLYEGATAGKADHSFDLGGKAEFFLNVDASKLGLWNGFGMEVHGEYNFGTTPGSVGGTTYPNNVGTAFPYQNEPGGDLTSVYFTQRFSSNLTLLAGKMNMFDFYDSGHKFSGGRGIESFWGTAFVGPPSGIVPVAAFGAVAAYTMDPLKFTAMVYDSNDALNRTGFEHPFSEGITFRGSVDVSSAPFGLARTDSLMAAISSEKGTDFNSLPNLGGYNTPELRRALIQSLILNGLFGQNAQA
jgi:porin